VIKDDYHNHQLSFHSLLRRWWGCSAKPPSRIPDHEQYHDHGYHTVPEAPVCEIHRYLLSCYARQPGECFKPWPVVAATSSPNHQEGTPKQTEIEVVVCRIVGGEPARYLGVKAEAERRFRAFLKFVGVHA